MLRKVARQQFPMYEIKVNKFRDSLKYGEKSLLSGGNSQQFGCFTLL